MNTATYTIVQDKSGNIFLAPSFFSLPKVPGYFYLQIIYHHLAIFLEKKFLSRESAL